MLRKIAFLAGAALLGGPALAETVSVEDGTASDQGRQQDIIVTAARTVLPARALPMTVDVIESESLAEQVAISGSLVDAVAALAPSFSPTRQKLSGAGETLRGRSPLYAINGIPQSTPIRDGSRDGYTIDPFFIDRVELIYGSNALQGIGATGGVVNQVIVGPPRRDGISGRVLLQGTAEDGFPGDGIGGKAAGLVGWRGGAFDVTAGLAFERRGAFYDGEGRRIGVDGTQGEIQDSRSWSAFGRLGWALADDVRLDLVANRFELQGDGDYVAVAGNRATGLPTYSVRGTSEGIPPANRVETLALTLTHGDLAGGDLTAQIFFNRSRDTFGGSNASTFQDPAIAPVGTLFDQSSNRSRKLGGSFSYERALLENLNATIGLDLLTDRTAQLLIATDRVWVPPVEFRSVAPFAQANLALADGLIRLAGGLRWENVRLQVDDFTTLASSRSTFVAGGAPEFRDLLVNGGAILEPIDGLRIYGAYAEGYTVPDVGRILRAVSTPGLDVDDFLDISPVVSNNREIGVELDRGPLNASAVYFRSSSKLGQFLVNNGGIFDVQRQRIEIEGVELNLGVETPIDGLSLSAGYAHLQGRTDSNGDGKVDVDLDGANISPDRLNLAGIYSKGRLDARIQAQHYLSRRFAGGDPRNDFGGYALVDAAVRYQLGLGALSLSVQNLLDTPYITYNSDTTNPADNLRFFAGRGRTMTLGWDYRF